MSAAGPAASPGKEKAAVRPDGGFRMQALATGTLRADPVSGCLWLEREGGKVVAQILLQGESYSVDFSTRPAAVLDGERVVARADSRVELGGGFDNSLPGVDGCPATGGPFRGYFED